MSSAELTIRYCPVCGTVVFAADTCSGTAEQPHEPMPTLNSPIGHWENRSSS
jgi:hypothetical protein